MLVSIFANYLYFDIFKGIFFPYLKIKDNEINLSSLENNFFFTDINELMVVPYVTVEAAESR